MSAAAPNQDSLDHVHELNRLFLIYLQIRLRADGDCAGLPEVVRESLRHATRETISAVAVFPRSLFDLKIDERETVALDPTASLERGAQSALGYTILHCAWTLSRQSVYQARVLLGLDARTIQRLRALQVGELAGLACTPALVVCAFQGRDWIWAQLVKEARPEARQHLALVALQPGVGRDWPARRAGRGSV